MRTIPLGARRAIAMLLAVAVVASASVVVLTAQVAAATKTVSGTLTIPDQASPTFSKSAVAVITLLDRSPGPQTGAVIGQQTIAAPKAVPLAYSVSYDARRHRLQPRLHRAGRHHRRGEHVAEPGRPSDHHRRSHRRPQGQAPATPQEPQRVGERQAHQGPHLAFDLSRGARWRSSTVSTVASSAGRPSPTRALRRWSTTSATTPPS